MSYSVVSDLSISSIFMIKNEKFFFIIATGIYLIVLFHYDFSVPIHMNFFLKGYEFVIGMMIGYYHEKFNLNGFSYPCRW